MSNNSIFIGIDPGVNTGIAVYDKQSKKLIKITTCKIHEAFQIVISFKDSIKLVRVEDARKRKFLGENAEAKKQGAGSVKRDCKMWEDFLTQNNVPFELTVPGKVKTKVDKDYFKMLTGWKGLTSNHARDAAMLVFGF